ncbi:MAG: phosphate ABC transporter permease subunit PstC [Thermodesulfobacteriota bacterium]
MSPTLLFVAILILSASAYYLGVRRAFSVVGGPKGIRNLHSLPSYYGWLSALWVAIPTLMLFGFWLMFESTIITQMVVAGLPPELRELPSDRMTLVINDIRNLVAGNITSDKSPQLEAAARHYEDLMATSHLALAVVALAVAAAGAAGVWLRIRPNLRARNQVERVLKVVMIVCSVIAILTTVGIIASVLFESIRFFHLVPITEFLFGLEWNPQIAIRADQVAGSGAFGAIPVFAGTVLISAIAMLVAVPIGLMSAIYLSEYASKRVRSAAKPLMEILAGIPTVVYGFFAALVVAPSVRDLGASVGLSVSSESALAAGVVMGIMIIPFVSSLSDDVINAVPQSLRDGAYALGATQSEAVKHVVIPAALPGIVGGVLLAVSRAIGETMIVVMAAGLAANLTANPFATVTTVTVQIVTLLTGDQEFDNPKTLAAFALGLILFIVTLLLNVIALYMVRKYREQYE